MAETSETVASKAGRVLNDPGSSPDARSVAGSALHQREAGLGTVKPFSAKEAVATEGVDNETGLFEGVHPDTNERMSVTLAGLQAEFGKELGEKKYLQIAGLGGGSVFFNPSFEATSFRPPLGIGGLARSLEELQGELGAEVGQEKFNVNQKYAAKVADILAAKE